MSARSSTFRIIARPSYLYWNYPYVVAVKKNVERDVFVPFFGTIRSTDYITIQKTAFSDLGDAFEAVDKAVKTYRNEARVESRLFVD